MFHRPFIFLLVMSISAAMPAAARAADSISGTVHDSQGAVVANAEVILLTGDRTVVASTRTTAQGSFAFANVAPGSYLIVVRSPSFAEQRVAVTVTASGRTPSMELTLAVAALTEDVSVTAARDLVESTGRTGQAINVITTPEIEARVRTVVAEAVEGEAGVALQRTSPTMAGVFVRGLTGNKVNVFVDGVRYSNGAQRGGVNTFLDLIEPGALDSIEVLRGPSSVQYGSDALGGSVQFLTKAPPLAVNGGPKMAGTASVSVGSGHKNVGGHAAVSFMQPTIGLTVAGSGRSVGLLRPGGGFDSHAAVTRFLGIKSDRLMDSRLPDTGFSQGGGSARVNWTPSTHTQLVGSYMRTYQDGGKRYDQLLGGDGNLIADLNGLSLDLFSLRLERLAVGGFDHASFTYSLNSQREERVNQGGNGSNTATIGHEPERTTVHGLQASASRQLSPKQTLSVGGDLYLERLTSDATTVNPVATTTTPRRPRVPSGATFRQGGVWAQTMYAVRDDVTVDGSVRVGGAHYEAHASDSPLVNGLPLWPDDSLTASSVTFRAGIVASLDPKWTVAGNISRGFRAPHMTDLGTLGLTGSGFEVAAPDVKDLGGTIGTTADSSAVSTGRPVEQVRPETSLNYEGSVRFRDKRVHAQATIFVNNIHDNIQKQALILPANAAGTSLGGQLITSQNVNGAVFVAATTVPVLVRANFDEARIWGFEVTVQGQIVDYAIARAAFTYLRAKDTTTDLSPNIEGGTPAPDLYVSARLGKSRDPWWIEPYAHFAWEQTHLSSLDLGDRRTGAARSRGNIQSFFRNGARNRGWVDVGPDGIINNADDRLILTGETLSQIQDRVLGVGVNSAPMFPSIPGYASIGVRFGLRHKQHELIIDAENLGDENYRGLSWGVDAPGRGITVRYGVKF